MSEMGRKRVKVKIVFPSKKRMILIEEEVMRLNQTAPLYRTIHYKNGKIIATTYSIKTGVRDAIRFAKAVGCKIEGALNE